MNKVYQRTYWENKPSEKTPINESNLNKMDYALDEIDNRVVKFARQKDAMETATQNASTAAANANTATANATKATESANKATQSANQAANNANEAAQAIFDEKYILTARTEFAKSTRVSPTAKGNAILEKLRGDSWQDTSIGKNLWSHGDISFVTSDYKSINITSGTYTVSALVTTGSPDNTSVIVFHGVSGATIRVPFIANTNGRVSNKVVLNESITGVSFYSMGDGGTSGDSATWSDIQIEVGEVETEFEEYFGTSPSPNKPQIIHSVGDTGWFDEEWLQGVLNETTGAWSNNDYRVYSPSYIPCKEGDVLNIVCEIPRLIRLAYYDKDKLYISSAIYTDNIIVPGNVAYFRMSVLSELNVSKITPSTVGHVCVTINGKYALIVDESNDNLFGGLAFANALVQSGATSVIDTNAKTVTLKGDANTQKFSYTKFKKNTQYTFIVKGINTTSSDARLTNLQVRYADGTTSGLYFSTDRAATKMLTQANKSVVGVYGNWNSGIAVFDYEYFGIFEGNVNIGDFTPHQSTRHYIPLDEPLRGINEVADEIVPQEGAFGQYRQNCEIEINGTEKDAKIINNSYRLKLDNCLGMWTIQNSMCTHFQYSTDAYYSTTESYSIDKNGNCDIYKSGFTTLEEYVAWFKENPVGIVYRLAEPTFTPFEDQTPFYNLMAYDEVTHVSIVGHEELNPMATIRFPRNEDGALVTTNWCDNKKNEIAMNELKVALMELGRL